MAYLARALTVEGFGRITFSQAIVTYFTLLTDLGLKTIGVSEIAGHKEKIKLYVNNILSLRMVLAAISFILLLFFAAVINKPAELKLLIVFFGLSLFPSALLLDWFFQGIERLEFVGIATAARSLSYVALIFLFVKSYSNILSVPLIIFISFFVIVLPLIYYFIKYYGRISFSFDVQFWKGLLIKALPLGIAFIAIQIYYNIDTLMLGFMKNEETVGWYNAAYKIVLFFVAFAGAIGASILPVMSNYYQTSKEKLKILIEYSSKLMIFLGLPIAICGLVAAKDIILFIYGSGYENSILALKILIWQVFTVFVNVPFAYCLLACEGRKYYMYSVVLGAIINIVLNLILIPRYSLIGAAIATIISEIIVLTALYIFSLKIIYAPIGKYAIKIVICSSLLGGLIYFLKFNLWINFFIGALFYLSANIVLKSFSLKEIKFILGGQNYGAQRILFS